VVSGSRPRLSGRYLLIVAFDIVSTTAVVPLFGAFYTNNPSPRAALLSIIGGGLTRIILEFALPKDGSLLVPFDRDNFLDCGPVASIRPPAFIDVNVTEVWDPSEGQCFQEPFADYTGIESPAAPLVGLIIFVAVQCSEFYTKKPLFEFKGGKGYEKDVCFFH
jgi:hypothetical protein